MRQVSGEWDEQQKVGRCGGLDEASVWRVGRTAEGRQMWRTG